MEIKVHVFLHPLLGHKPLSLFEANNPGFVFFVLLKITALVLPMERLNESNVHVQDLRRFCERHPCISSLRGTGRSVAENVVAT